MLYIHDIPLLSKSENTSLNYPYFSSHHENMPNIFLTPLLYSKTGVYRVYIIFLISAKEVNSWYSFEMPRRGGSNGYLQCIF